MEVGQDFRKEVLIERIEKSDTWRVFKKDGFVSP